MKTLYFILALFFGASQGFGQGIAFFKGNLNELMARAKNTNRIVFVDAYTTWCGPCKHLSKSIFPQKEVGDFYNAHFISYSLDMEKGEGIEFAKKYKVRAYPTLLFIDSLGKLVHRSVGSSDAKHLLELGEVALDPERNLGGKMKRYREGEREEGFIRDYLRSAAEAYMDVKEAADWYFYTQSEEQLMSKENIELIVYLVEDVDHKGFRFLLHNEAQCQTLTDIPIARYLERTYTNALYKAKRKGEVSYEELLHKMKTSGYAHADKILAKMELQSLRHAAKKDWPLITQKIDEYLTKYAVEDSDFRNSMAWSYYTSAELMDEGLLEHALRWAKESVRLNKRYMNMDTYAALLYKLKRKEAAKKAALEAIELAQKEGSDASETETLLGKIEELP